jgi:NADH-quinone oxidoreductase subunit L
VAAGVFLVARVYPLMEAVPTGDSPVIAATHATAVSPAAANVSPTAKPAPAPVPGPGAGTNKTSTTATAGATATATATNAMGAASTKAAGHGEAASKPVSFALKTVTWVGAITALFAALIAVAQTDIKRILAYSTVSQLGFMFMGLGVGGVAVGMFHLLTHAFFKALLFLGSGSVIHGCHEEQDIRKMGGLMRPMPVTFATYAIGMLALSGFPLFFSGFYSKDEILHSAALWAPSRWPFIIGLTAAFLTAFYMTRQMWYVFLRAPEWPAPSPAPATTSHDPAPLPSPSPSHEAASSYSPHTPHSSDSSHAPHESPGVMTVPLIILAACTVLFIAFATPVWPWFHSYLSGHGTPALSLEINVGTLLVMALSSIVALGGMVVGWRLYTREGPRHADELDPLERWQPDRFALLREKFKIDELYEKSVIRLNAWAARRARWLDDKVWATAVQAVSLLFLGLSWLNRLIDEFVVNLGFDGGCGGLRNSARWVSLWQNGQVQRYLRVIGLALVLFGAAFLWGGRR